MTTGDCNFMKIGNHKMTKEQILEVVKMRQDGYSFHDIGRYFNKDHSTIVYHCQKAGISFPRSPIKKLVMERIGNARERKSKDPKPYIEDGDVINRGKNYEDYLDDENKRNWSKRNDIASTGL